MITDKRVKDAIEDFIQALARISEGQECTSLEALDGDETEDITNEVGRRLDEFFANEPSKKFARITWSVEDVFGEADHQGIEISEEEAEEFLEDNEKHIQEAMMEAGWEVISDRLGEFGNQQTRQLPHPKGRGL